MNDEPVIDAVAIAPGHDGEAEAVVSIRYPNGAVRSLAVDVGALGQIADAHGLVALSDLIGRPWSLLLDGVRPSLSARH